MMRWMLTLFLMTPLPPSAADELLPAVLQLSSGSVVPGTLLPGGAPHTLRWQSPLFQGPFEFSLDGVSAVNYRVPAAPPKPVGEYCVELVGGDVLFGELRALTEQTLTLDTARMGRVTLRRDHVQRLYRWEGGADLIYVGPNGLNGWKQSAPAQFREEGGHIVTDQPGASVRGNFDIPAQAIVEFELSWKTKPDFVFALGVDDEDNDVVFKRAYRFEIWDEELVVRCELGRVADVDSVEAITSGAGRAHYIAYLDQLRGRMLVYSPSGTPYAKINIEPRKPQSYSGLRLTNKRGDVRLERLRISRWDGVPPGEAQTDKARLETADGDVRYGEVLAYDDASRQFTFRTDGGETRLPAGKLSSIHLQATAEPGTRAMRVAYQDGSRLSGRPEEIADGRLKMDHPSSLEPLSLPLTGLRSLVVLQRDESAEAFDKNVEARVGRLELKGTLAGGEDEPLWFKEGLPDTRLVGRLVEGHHQPDASCLVWQPEFSATSSALKPGVAGRIVYREPQPQPPTRPKPQPQPQPAAGFAGLFLNTLRSAPAAVNPSSTQRVLYLRSGDTVPCNVSRIDEQGVTFSTSLSEATFVPHERIKAVDFVAGTGQPRLDAVKRERLLTLPRLQRDTPPTHLVRSRNGDFLRGRVIDLDDATLRIEVRLDVREIPRDRIAQIIWLHADELDEAANAERTVDEQPGIRVQALQTDGVRLTFFATQMAGQTLSGRSDVLGECHAGIGLIDQLLIGDVIDQAAAELTYNQWKLHRAIEPKIASDLPGGATGAESELVGQPAPDFTLPLLEGDKFRLSDARGKIVVLDFWATWCGPCMQTMPLMEELAKEFRDSGIVFVAVNLEELPNQIKSTLERQKLNPVVALDRDGATAAKYQVSGIPQTVIVDKDGKVARLYVGGGPQLIEQLSEALRLLQMPPAGGTE